MRKPKRVNGSKNTPILDGLALIQGWFGIIVLLLLVAIILTLVNLLVDWQPNNSLLMVIMHLCVFGGGLLVGFKCKQKAWLNGLIVGIGAFLLATWLGSEEGLLWSGVWFKRLLTIGLVSMIGGMLGGLKE